MPVTASVTHNIESTLAPSTLAASCTNNVLPNNFSLQNQTPNKPNTKNATIKNPLILLFCLREDSSPFSTDTYSLAFAI